MLKFPLSEDAQEDQESVGEIHHTPRPPGLAVATRVSVYEGDPLSRAGVVSHVAHQLDMTVVQSDPTTGSPEEDVAVVLLNRLDAAAAGRLQKLAADWGHRIVLVIDELDETQLEFVTKIGIHTIVWRHQATEARVVKAIRAARRDECDIPGDLLSRLMLQLGRRARGTALTTLAPGRPTPRELSVLELVSQGLGTKDIAERLNYSERTVKGILHDIMIRHHLRNRAHAVAFAIREGHM
jgi:DNA-binding NarL/FixJ family response regulator